MGAKATIAGVVLMALGALPVAAGQQPSFTAYERRVCGNPAMRYCASAYPSKRALMRCLQAHEPMLGGACRTALHRRLGDRASLSR